MGKWVKKKLGEVTSYMAKGITPIYTDGETSGAVSVLNQKCNRNYGISYSESRFHDNKKKRVPENKLLRKLDVLINSTGTGTAGRVAQIWELHGITTIDGHMILLRPTEEVDPLYYGYAIKERQHQIENLAEGTTGQTEINRRRLQEEVVVYFPESLEEQKNIAGVLRSIDEKIWVNGEINDNLAEIARSIFKSWFIDFEPYGGTVPQGWHESTLGQIAIIRTDSWSPTKEPGITVEHYSIPAFDDQHFPVFEISSNIKSNKYIVTSDSVLISKLNPTTKRIWRPMCITAHSVCSTEFIIYEARKRKQRDFIYSILDSSPFLHHLCSHVTGSTNSRQRATPKATLNFPIFLPPDHVVEEFCNIVTPIYNLISNNVSENQALIAARNSLLPKLMSGEL